MSYGDSHQTRVKRLRASLAAGLLGLACSSLLVGPQAAAASTVSPLPASDYGVRPVCATPAPGHAACLADELVPQTPAARAHARPLGMTHAVPADAGRSAEACELEPPTAAHGCYGLRPQDLHSAYQLPGGAESTQTIAIVDPFNDPSAEADLERYDQEFGLAACTAQDGCFQQVNERGEAPKFDEKGNATNVPFPVSVSERKQWELLCRMFKSSPKCLELEEAMQWDSEISLDIETAHGICQNCRLLLVEAASSRYPRLEEAEESAVRLGATEISDSWGQAPEPQRDSEAFNHPGVVVTAAAGDEGYLNWGSANPAESGSVDYPASSPHVVAVGGTRLRLQEGAWKEETVWNGGFSNERGHATGGGCSAVFGAPEWQLSASDWLSVGCGKKRSVSDVSADADPYTGAAIYNSDSKCEGHWCTLGGTSLASPLIAGVFALAGGAHGVEYPARTLYENEASSPRSLHDAVAGSNGECREAPTAEGLAGCSVEAEAKSCSAMAICLAGVGYDGPSGVGTPNGIEAFEPASTGGPKLGRPTSPAEPQREPQREPQSEQRETSTYGPGQGPPASSPVTGSIGAGTIQISQLGLTPRAVIALHRARPKPSQIGFSFSINAAAPVRATLARQVRIKGKVRWKPLAISLTIAASRGRNSRSLRGRNALPSGTYRLTLTPSRGIAQSIVIKLR